MRSEQAKKFYARGKKNDRAENQKGAPVLAAPGEAVKDGENGERRRSDPFGRQSHR